MRRSPSTRQRLRVPTMSKGETMEELMNKELNEAIASLNRANSALERIFGVQWHEGNDGTGVCDMCAGCPNCVEEKDND